MKDYYLYDDHGCIDGGFDTPQECEDVFNDHCEKGETDFSRNIVIVKVIKALK